MHGKTTINIVSIVIFRAGIMWLRESVQGLPSRFRRDGIILELAYFLENYVGTVNGNVVISDVDARIYVVLSNAEKHAPCGKLVGTRACITL
jgi:hypothetical protein